MSWIMIVIAFVYLTIVFLHRYDESDQGVVVEPFETEEIHEHEEGLLDFLRIVHIQGVESESVPK